jgi:hypothetical protein
VSAGLRAKTGAVASDVIGVAQTVDFLPEQPLQPCLALDQRRFAVLLPFKNSRSKAKKMSWSVWPASIAACRRLKTGTPSELSAQSSRVFVALFQGDPREACPVVEEAH